MKLAIMGYGVVGSGVAQVLAKNHESIAARSMQPDLHLKYILDIRDFPDDPFGHLVIRDFQVILNDPEVGIVVETMGGLRPAYDFVLACLKAGKSVVTSNKELVAAKGCELIHAAREHNVNFLFEASVGGGIPILRPLSQCLAANEINEVAGILNGTTNFILTRMIEDAMPFDAALRLAQENGYAEKDPTADVEGHDACRKICILAALAFGRHVYPEQVRTEGISGLTPEDVANAEAFGCAIKLLGRAKRLPDGRVTATVAPALVPHSCLLSCVSDVYNAIMVRGDFIGDVVFYGRGAGKLPTASAVVADVIDCGKHVALRKFFCWEEGQAGYVAPPGEDVARHYIRMESAPASGRNISGLFPEAELILPRSDTDSLALLTAPMAERDVLQKLRDNGLAAKMILRAADF